MADCGDLEKLPPDIRNEIYALALVEPGPFTLCNFGGDQRSIGAKTGRGLHAPKMNNEWARSDKTKVAPTYHTRHRKGIGYEYVGSKWVEVPSEVALLCVNKKIHMEAAPVLYGGTRFRFKNSNTMRRFLNLIGDNNQFLRDVGISAGGWEFRGGLYEARYALEALAAPKNLRTFEVSHLDICSTALGSRKVVKLCKPLLESLKVAYGNDDLKPSILEVIKIGAVCPPPGLFHFFGRTQAFERHAKKQRKYKRQVAEHPKLQRELKHLVAEQHALEVDS